MCSQAVQRLAILGSTGSVGESTLEVVRRHPNCFRVFALAANSQVERMLQQCAEFEPAFAVMRGESAAEELQQKVRQAGLGTEILSGETALGDIAGHAEVDSVMAAIVGAAGLMSTLQAARAGKRILLANKESLVMSGQLLLDEVNRSGATLLPIDSEHNAIFQCLPGTNSMPDLAGVERIKLTASGGPFLLSDKAGLLNATPDQACAHPTWAMGRKISVDSATMMNKGLEVIEACWLFGMAIDQIDVVIHPQSVIHSMVSYVDGSVLAQLGNPDMRTPIAHALAWPERISSGAAPLDFQQLSALTFAAPDFAKFPCLRLAYAAMRAGGTATTHLNAANEIAVAAFLDYQLRFTDIPLVIETVLEQITAQPQTSLDEILAADRQARELASLCVAQQSKIVA